MDREEKRFIGRKVRLNLKYLLEKNNLSEENLIEILNISKNAFLNAKYPDRKTPTLIRIAKYFELSVEELMNETLAFPIGLQILATEDGKDEFLRTQIKDIKAGNNNWKKIRTIDAICSSYKNIYNKKMFSLNVEGGVLYLLLGIKKEVNQSVAQGCQFLTYDTLVEYFTLLDDNSYEAVMSYTQEDYKEFMLAEKVLLALNDSMTRWDNNEECECYTKEKTDYGIGFGTVIMNEEVVDIVIDNEYSEILYRRKMQKERLIIDEDVSPIESFLDSAYHYINKGERSILEYIEKNPKATRNEIAQATGYSVDTIKKKIKSMKERDIIYRTNNFKGGEWVIK